MEIIVTKGMLDVMMVAGAIFGVCAAGFVGYSEVQRRRGRRQKAQLRDARSGKTRNGSRSRGKRR